MGRGIRYPLSEDDRPEALSAMTAGDGYPPPAEEAVVEEVEEVGR